MRILFDSLMFLILDVMVFVSRGVEIPRRGLISVPYTESHVQEDSGKGAMCLYLPKVSCAGTLKLGSAIPSPAASYLIFEALSRLVKSHVGRSAIDIYIQTDSTPPG
jgi:hypothetical protein